MDQTAYVHVGVGQGVLIGCLLFLYLGNSLSDTVTMAPPQNGDSKNYTDLYREYPAFRSPLCELIVNESDANNFLRLMLWKKADFAYLHLRFPPSVAIKYGGDVFLPKVWVWTTSLQDSGYPFLRFQYDAGKLSFGLLDFYTLRNITLDLEPKQKNCSLDFDADNTTTAIATALGNMALDHFPPNLQRNYSLFCHIIKFDPVSNGQPLFYIYTYFGYWQDPTAYVCCNFYRDENSTLKIRCGGKPFVLTDWPTLFYFLSVIFFLYLPLPVSRMCDYITDSPGNADVAQGTGGQETSEDSANEEVPLLDADIQCGPSDRDPHNEVWFYLGTDKPVNWIYLVGTPFRCIREKFPTYVSKLQRFFLFSILIPLPLYAKIVFYMLRGRFSTNARIKAGIPVGFLSIPYGLRLSVGNWLTGLGGPIVLLAAYLTVGQICICAPKDICALFMSAFKRRGYLRKRGNLSKGGDLRMGGSVTTLLSLDLSAIEHFGAVQLHGKTSHRLVYSLMLGNLYTLLNPSFWKSVCTFATNRFKQWFNPENHYRIVVFILAVLYISVFCGEVILCVLYYGCPIIFYWVNLTKAFIRHYALRSKFKVLWTPVILLCLVFTYYAFFLIFIRGMFFVLSAINHTYIGVIVYPSIALGFVIGVGTMLLYVGSSSQKLIDSYLLILYDLVSISIQMEKSRETENVAKLQDNSIVLRNVDGRRIQKLDINGMVLDFTREQRQILSLAWPALNSNSRHLGKVTQYVRWRGENPGIPAKLFHYVIEKHHPLRAAVFIFLVEFSAFLLVVTSVVNLIIEFDRVSSFTLPAQVVTAIVLTVLPKLNDFLISPMEKLIQKEIKANRLKIAVKQFYVEASDTVSRENTPHLYSGPS